MDKPIEMGDEICFISDEDGQGWGIVTGFSDDGTTVYFQPRGMGLFHSSAVLSKVRHLTKKDIYTWVTD